MFRKIGVIHGDYRYDVVMRDLSRTGAKIEGLVGVPVDTQLVLDLGNGHWLSPEWCVPWTLFWGWNLKRR